MKFGTALFLLLISVCRLPAQLSPGAVAPDFIAQDINGQSWHLYELLDEGKIVVLEISATWCPPCWAYHKGHALQKFYEAHGPAGDNKAQVLFIEGDPETNTECLYGLPDCNGFTSGNWVEGTTYPYIDNAAIPDSFAVDYYPTIYVICPNKKVYQVGQLTAEQLWEHASGCPVAFGANNAGIFYHEVGTQLREICDTMAVQPSFKLINLGTYPLTNALIDLRWNNELKQTLNWNGTLPLYGEALLAFDSLPLAGEGILKTTLASINNGQGDEDYANNVYNENFSVAQEFNTQQIILKIKTDNWGVETYWELRDDSGNVLYHGGNSNVGPDGGGIYGEVMPGPGAYGNNVLINKILTLPGYGCYSILFVDAYGDGMCCAYGNGYYKLYNINNPTVPILSGGEFQAVEHRGFSVSDPTAIHSASGAGVGVRLFPNPAGDLLNIELNLDRTSAVRAVVVNALGQVVHEFDTDQIPAGEHRWSLPLDGWPAGLYFIHFQLDTSAFSRTFIVDK